MINKILNLVKQMGEDDKKHLFQRIQREYCLEEKTDMLRDDIRDKVFDLITANFTCPRFIVQEHYNWIELNMDAIDVTALSDMLIIAFELEQIEFAKIMEWQTVADIVNYIEDNIQGKDDG